MGKGNKYFVYMHVNKINNKKYIGITCRKKPEHRWGKDGNSYKGQVFKIAIDKYGWNNFEHIILFSNLSNNDAYLKEKELIELYRTNEKDYGYNLSTGGEHGSTGYLNNSMSIPVCQYNLDGDFIMEFPSLSEAERVTGISNSFISRCCKNKSSYTKDFQWSYEKVENIGKVDKFLLYSKHNKGKGKSVKQYDSNGNFIKLFNTINDAVNETGIKMNGIYKCCINKAKLSGGYHWSY